MQRLKLTLAYMGKRFQGWQIQERVPGAGTGTNPRTVQGVVEEAFAKILGGPEHMVRVHGAGRTDSGVHAVGQVAHVDVPERSKPLDWQLALNGVLPRDVSVVDVEIVDSGFHARFDAQRKIYTYTLWHSRRFVLPHRRGFVWMVDKLDTGAMREAASLFIGEHDFAAFTNAGTVTKTTVRKVLTIKPVRCASTGNMAGGHIPGAPEWPEDTWRFEAQGFLKQMVRNLMGCMVAVGRGKLSIADVQRILEGKDRTQAPMTAPAQGLTLLKIFYP